MYQLYIEYIHKDISWKSHNMLDFDTLDKVLAFIQASEDKMIVCNIKKIDK